MPKPRQPRSAPSHPDSGRLDRIEAQTRETAEDLSRWKRELADDRLGRIERTVQATADHLDEFGALVRGAFTVQQDQIANLYRTATAQQTQIAELRETVNQVIREWQAYLRTIHPPQ